MDKKRYTCNFQISILMADNHSSNWFETEERSSTTFQADNVDGEMLKALENLLSMANIVVKHRFNEKEVSN